jgi:hypothetical protein
MRLARFARFRRHCATLIWAAAALPLLTACDPLSMTLLGIGAGAGINHQLNGIAYKTFTESLPRVKRATIVALNRMAIKVETVEKTASGETIKAKASDRNIEVALESLTPNTTRVRTVARQSALSVDSSTAVEIIVQTERALGA